jgi:hypothetical protein
LKTKSAAMMVPFAAQPLFRQLGTLLKALLNKASRKPLKKQSRP